MPQCEAPVLQQRLLEPSNKVTISAGLPCTQCVDYISVSITSLNSEREAGGAQHVVIS